MRVFIVLLASACLLAAAGEKFSGKWSSSQNDADGTIDIQLTEPPEVTFTLRGQQVKTKVLTFKIEGAGVELRYSFDLDGNKLVSRLTGEITGSRFAGKYQTTADDGEGVVDNGTFTARAR
jgi:hypothetical protein